MSRVRFVTIRVEFPERTGDRAAMKLADQLVEFAGSMGSVYIADEGVMDATEEDDQS